VREVAELGEDGPDLVGVLPGQLDVLAAAELDDVVGAAGGGVAVEDRFQTGLALLALLLGQRAGQVVGPGHGLGVVLRWCCVRGRRDGREQRDPQGDGQSSLQEPLLRSKMIGRRPDGGFRRAHSLTAGGDVR
jgi:hypothetical protein